MTQVLSPQMLALFLVFTVPGIIALYFRAQFMTGRMPSVSEGLISYVTLSLIYHAIAYPVAWPLYQSTRMDGLFAKPEQIGGFFALGWFGLIFVAPAVLGFLLGLNVRKGWAKKLIKLLGLNTVHAVGSAWDWRFGDCNQCWVHVVLKDGTKWAGLLGEDSFLSSDPAERDMFIEKVFVAGDDGESWTPRNSSVWIAHGEVQSMEFLPYN